MVSQTKVTYQETPAYAIARILNEKGYQIADSLGMKIEEPEHSVLGILEPRETTKGFLGIKTRQRALFPGVLYLDENHGLKDNKQWVMKIYGRENIPKMKKLAEEISAQYDNVGIKIILDSENPRFESRLSDFGD